MLCGVGKPAICSGYVDFLVFTYCKKYISREMNNDNGEKLT